MTVKLKDRSEIAENMLSLTFDAAGQDLKFTAGQFCSITLINPPYTDNRGNSRFLGFTTSPSELPSFSVLTRIGESSFKKSLLEIPIGVDVGISGIDGRIKLPEDKTQPLVFIPFNVGIAPIMGILRYCRENSWPYDVTLIYINKNEQEAAFFDELKNFSGETDKFRFIPVMTDDPAWTRDKGPVNAQFIKEHFPNPGKTLFFVTGAAPLVPNTFREIIAAGAPTTNLKMEIFTGY